MERYFILQFFLSPVAFFSNDHDFYPVSFVLEKKLDADIVSTLNGHSIESEDSIPFL